MTGSADDRHHDALEQLRQRRDVLVERAAAQREDLSRLMMEFETPLRVVDAGIAIGRALYIHRRIVALGGAFSPNSAPARMLVAGSRLLTGWQVTRIVGAHLRSIRRRLWPARPALPGGAVQRIEMRQEARPRSHGGVPVRSAGADRLPSKNRR